MSQRQLQRLHVMGFVEGGKITLKEAAKKISVSYRQAKRIRRTLRVKGVKGIIHGNTGRAPWNRTRDSIRQRVLEFSREMYEITGGQATEIRYFLILFLVNQYQITNVWLCFFLAGRQHFAPTFSV